MRHKKNCAIVSVAFGAVICTVITVICVFLAKYTLDRQTYEKIFLVPFHEVYDVLCEKYPFITSLHEEAGNDGSYGMYYIECGIAENIDCFSELVDVQREISELIEARKDDEWFNGFEGHIEVYSDCQQLRVFYHNGSMSNEVWANDVISDDYSVLWNAFPKNDEISLVIFLTDYSDEIKSQITQKYEGRNIIVRRQIGG